MEVLTVLSQAWALGGEFLSEAGKKALSEQVIITGVILYSVRGHFKDVRNGLSAVRVEMSEGMAKLTESITELARALAQLESAHSAEIKALKRDVSDLKKFTKFDQHIN